MQSPYQAPEPLPSPSITKIRPGLLIVNSLSRSGRGPGIFVVVEETSSGLSLDHGIPSPTRKWAEEGYCVVEVSDAAFNNPSLDPLDVRQAALEISTRSSTRLKGKKYVAAAVLYGDATSNTHRSTSHFSVTLQESMNQGICDSAPAAVSPPKLCRIPTFLKKHMNGPYFGLEDIWDEHTHWGFVNRSVENTMNTMVKEPYVNHIPTMTGGIGRRELTDFYTNHFIFSNPQDARLDLISRTVDVDRVVDKFIYCCTHDQTIDWLLPVVPPTGRDIQIPMMAVVNFHGDPLYHEHIHFDAATALKQVGAIPDFLAVENVEKEKFVFEAPVTGIEGAELRDQNSSSSNEMFRLQVRKFPFTNGH